MPHNSHKAAGKSAANVLAKGWHALRPTAASVSRVNHEGIEVTRRTLVLPPQLIAVLLLLVVLLAVLTPPYEQDPSTIEVSTDAAR